MDNGEPSLVSSLPDSLRSLLFLFCSTLCFGGLSILMVHVALVHLFSLGTCAKVYFCILLLTAA